MVVKDEREINLKAETKVGTITTKVATLASCPDIKATKSKNFKGTARIPKDYDAE